MPIHSRKTNLFLVNFTTGISDGLILPFAACMVAFAYFAETPLMLMGIGIAVASLGALAYGLARFFGEREEIRHNHPAMATDDIEKEAALMNAIGIDKEVTMDMQDQMQEERALWLNEVMEHQMGWENYDVRRAVSSGLHTAGGFFIGGLIVTLPFYYVSTDLWSLLLPCFIYLALYVLLSWIKGNHISPKPLNYTLVKSSKGLVVLVLILAVTLFVTARREHITYREGQTVMDITP